MPPPPLKALDWLWERITQYSTTTWDYVRDDLPGLSGRLELWFATWWEQNVEIPQRDELERQISRQEALGLPSEIADEMRQMRQELPTFIAGFGVGMLLVWVKFRGFLQWAAAQANLHTQDINADIKPNLADQGSLYRLLQLDPTRASEIAPLLDKWGVPNEQQEMTLAAMQQLPQLGELLTLRNRELIDDDRVIQTLLSMGFQGDDPEKLLELRYFYPSPSDLTMLAAREAFEPDAIAAFKMLTDFPDELPGIMSKAGMKQQWAEAYWVAHWQNPSIQQVFEMIHRKVLKEDGQPFSMADLDIYYKLADINPFFGDLLRQIAHAPLTRVDIRRFRARNLLTADQTIEAYEALGYNKAHAKVQADFAEDERRRFGRELSRTQLERLRRIGEISDAQLEEQLTTVGYDREEAGQLTLLLAIAIETDRTEAERERIEYLFKRHQLDEVEAGQALSAIGVQGISVDETLEKWRDERVVQRTLPSKTDLLKWLDDRIIEPVAFVQNMELHRYDAGDIGRYLEAAGFTLNDGEWYESS